MNHTCPVCGNDTFNENSVLWPDLIHTWQLTQEETAYINRQQGYHCTLCNNNLRSMGLAAAILDETDCNETLFQFGKLNDKIKILEINTAGGLTPFLSLSKYYTFVEYPDYDMQNLNIDSDSFDLVVHSDTLEHVPDPVKALSECKRVLRKNGKCIFTVPILVDKLSRSRSELAPSYHGRPDVLAADQLVCTEFGIDVWKTVISAGFRSCKLYVHEYPSAIVIVANN
jgi:SAM-dependent methyltransferase